MNEQAHSIRQERFSAQEIIVPVGGYCYCPNIREGFYENNVLREKVPASHQPSAAVTLKSSPSPDSWCYQARQAVKVVSPSHL